MTDERVCTVPPEGWWCSREKGHDGPCAARQGAAGAWANLNRILDEHGGSDSPEYRAAFAAWERVTWADREPIPGE